VNTHRRLSPFITAGSRVHEKFDRNLIELRIAQAYAELLGASDGGVKTRSISLAKVEDHEIRMFVFFPADDGEAPLFWMELFDHRTPASVDTYACRELASAADVFEEFRSEAGLLEAGRRHDGTVPQS
jgi:hypothetical protein